MRVHQAISDPALFEISIMLLAERCGFTEKTAFSRAYRAMYGAAPRSAPRPAEAFAPQPPGSQRRRIRFWSLIACCTDFRQ
jgi:AraC-like DNA-binding protein